MQCFKENDQRMGGRIGATHGFFFITEARRHGGMEGWNSKVGIRMPGSKKLHIILSEKHWVGKIS